jgi:hypothetical protein
LAQVLLYTIDKLVKHLTVTTLGIERSKVMSWKFWQKEKQSEGSFVTKEVKLAKPREIPQPVGMYLVTQLKLDPDWVWSLKCAMLPKADQKNNFEIRIFNPTTADARAVSVLNYNSLDLHPDMVLFYGSYNRNTGSVLIETPLEKVA